MLQSRSVVSPDSVRNGECSSSPSGAVSRDLGGSSRDLGGSSRELGGSSPIRSLDGSEQKSFSSSSDARSRERWRSMARRGSVNEGNHQDILGQDIRIRISWAGTRIPFTHNDNLLSGQNGSGAKRKSERKGSSSAGEIQTFGIRKYELWQTQDSYFSEDSYVVCNLAN